MAVDYFNDGHNDPYAPLTPGERGVDSEPLAHKKEHAKRKIGALCVTGLVIAGASAIVLRSAYQSEQKERNEVSREVTALIRQDGFDVAPGSIAMGAKGRAKVDLRLRGCDVHQVNLKLAKEDGHYKDATDYRIAVSSVNSTEPQLTIRFNNANEAKQTLGGNVCFALVRSGSAAS